METTILVRSVRFGLVAAALLVWRPSPAEACSCAGPVPLSVALHYSEIVFVGTVARIDVDDRSGSAFVLFDVAQTFKGLSAPQISVTQSGMNCDLPFKGGEQWVVYAREGEAGVTSSKCMRSRLAAEAKQDLLYLHNADEGRPQGILYGDVFRRRHGPSGLENYVPSQSLQVVATNETSRFVTSTDRWGPFELVLPPGDYLGWVERDGKPVSRRSAVHVEHGADTRLSLIAEYVD